RPDQGAGHAVSVHHVEQDQHDLGHRKEAVVRRIEHPDDEKRRCPGNDLGDDLAPGTPDYRLPHLVQQAGSRWSGRVGFGHSDAAIAVPAMAPAVTNWPTMRLRRRRAWSLDWKIPRASSDSAPHLRLSIFAIERLRTKRRSTTSEPARAPISRL